MHSRSLWVVVIVSALLVLSVGISGALAGSWLAPDAPVAGKINYQGRLTTPGARRSTAPTQCDFNSTMIRRQVRCCGIAARSRCLYLGDCSTLS